MGLALTSWPKYMHDTRNTGVAEVEVKTDGAVKWRYYVGTWVYSSPAIGPDAVYFGADDGYLYAVSQADGSLLWRYRTGAYIRGSPAVDDRLVVYVKSSDGYLYAVNHDGSLRWRYYSGQWYRSHVNIVGDTVYFSDRQSFFAINRVTGNAEWVYSGGFRFRGGPAVGSDGTIYVGAQDSQGICCLVAFYPNGTLRWVYDIYGLITIPGSPSVGPDGTIYFHNGGLDVYAINPDGSRKWVYRLDHPYIYEKVPEPPFVDATGIYVCDYDRIYRLGFDGTLLWKSRELSLTSMVVVDAASKVYVATELAELIVFDSQGNEVAWYFIRHSADYPGAVGPDGVLYLSQYNYVQAYTLSAPVVGGCRCRRAINPMVLLNMAGVTE